MIKPAVRNLRASLIIQASAYVHGPIPNVRSITQARGIWKDYLKEYRAYLSMFRLKGKKS